MTSSPPGASPVLTDWAIGPQPSLAACWASAIPPGAAGLCQEVASSRSQTARGTGHRRHQGWHGDSWPTACRETETQQGGGW